MNNEEQLRLIDIDNFKGKIYRLDKGEKCILCHTGETFSIDKNWKPPVGIDEKMIKVKCVTCDKEYYLLNRRKK